MRLILNLPPETEAKLKEHAAAVGKPPEEVALRALEAHLAASAPPKGHRQRRKLTPEEWAADLEKWAESHRRLEHEADDSRESIYSGRGE